MFKRVLSILAFSVLALSTVTTSATAEQAPGQIRGIVIAQNSNSPLAKKLASEYLDRVRGHGPFDLGGDEFYGYYTFDVKKGGAVLGMLSVNAFSGQVWYHAWHGGFIDMQEGTTKM